MQPKWRKLVKTETLWALEALLAGLHFTQDGEDHWVLPGDYIVDMATERIIYRGRDFEEMIDRENWKPQSVRQEWNGALVYVRAHTVEVVNHVAGGIEHPDLWLVAGETQVQRQDYIDKLLADGYVWEEVGNAL